MSVRGIERPRADVGRRRAVARGRGVPPGVRARRRVRAPDRARHRHRERLLDDLLRGVDVGRVVASVLRIVRDIDTAEEVVQEAFAQALDRWPADGTPERPGAWLLTTARRRALDRLRHARRAGARADALAYEAALGATDEGPEVTDPAEIPDDRLRLIFTCCHPGLPADSRVALTLRLVGGLSTAEIARAFLVPEPTIAQRLLPAQRTRPERDTPSPGPPVSIARGRWRAPGHTSSRPPSPPVTRARPRGRRRTGRGSSTSTGNSPTSRHRRWSS